MAGEVTPVEGGADDRASMLAELRAIDRGGAPSEKSDTRSETVKPIGQESADGGGDLDADVGEDSGGLQDSVSDADEAEDTELDAEPEIEPEEDEAKPDPETAKRFQQVQRQEKRAREALAAERREFEADRAKWQDENKAARQELEEFNKLKERARYNLTDIAKKLGISEEEFEYHAEQFYRRSPKGQKDPRHKEIAERTVREREQADRIERLERQIKEDREAREQRELQAEQKKAADEYLDRAAKAVKAEKAPIVAHLLGKDPERAREKLRLTAAKMIRETGEVPAHAEVVAALEKFERAKWSRLGLDIPKPGGTNDASGNKTPAKNKQPGAGANGRPQPKTDDGSERPAPKSPEEERQEIVRAMREGNLDD